MNMPLDRTIGDTTAVIVTYNRLETLKKCLDHVTNQILPPKYIIVVDNNSADGTKEYLSSRAHKDIIPIFSDHNLGFGYGLNLGCQYIMDHRLSEYVWLLDDDSFPAPDVLLQLRESFHQNDKPNERIGILGSIGCRITWTGDTVVISDHKAGPVVPADFVLVDNSLVKISVLAEVGNIYPDFFIMCEDYEFSKRLDRNNFKILLLQNVTVERLHLGGGTVYSPNTVWRGYYHSRNHLLILKRYFSFAEAFHYFFRQFKYLASALLFAPDRWKRVRLRLSGMLDGIKGVKGKTLDPKTHKFLSE
jgi:rhamnopyranosyl-N-acetylglucosaminyl-diphospho-decaprenol beta-1,3/1,4-galactofuranosyltransferase